MAPTSLNIWIPNSRRAVCNRAGKNMEANGKTMGKQAFPMVFRALESQPTLGSGRHSPGRWAKPQPKAWAWAVPNGPCSTDSDSSEYP